MATPAIERFVTAARELGLEPDVKTFPEDTRTAQQAADALGCELDLLDWQTVWAAAGAPDAVFELTPSALVDVTGAEPADIRAG